MLPRRQPSILRESIMNLLYLEKGCMRAVGAEPSKNGRFQMMVTPHGTKVPPPPPESSEKMSVQRE